MMSSPFSKAEYPILIQNLLLRMSIVKTDCVSLITRCFELNRVKFLFSLLGLILFSSFIIQSHAQLADNSDIPPRGVGIKDSPCGENKRTSNPKVLNAGSKVIIRWIETVEHTGNYWIEFSKANDKDWIRLKTVADTQNNSNDLPHYYETTITVPSINCDAYTIRVVQEMLDNHADMPTYYYSCVDIKIINGKC